MGYMEIAPWHEAARVRKDLSTFGQLRISDRQVKSMEQVSAMLTAGTFDAVVYANARTHLLFWEIVRPRYSPDRVAFVDSYDHANATTIRALAQHGRYFLQ